MNRIINIKGRICAVFATKIIFITLIGISNFTFAQSGPLVSSYGVWDRGFEHNLKTYPFIRGASSDCPWDNIEKKSGVYDWSSMDVAVEKAYKNKMSVYLSFEAGPKTPDWVYEEGVPKVTTNDQMHDKFPYYPYYLSPIYKKLYTRFITEAAKHIHSYPIEKQAKIAFIQVKTGCTGDETPYKGESNDKNYDLPKEGADWQNFRTECFALYAKLFDQIEPKISLLFGSISADEDGGKDRKYQQQWDWVTKNITGVLGIKAGALSRGSHFADEKTIVNNWQKYLIDPKGLKFFARSEMDQSWQRPVFQLNVQLNFYWAAINALNLGQSIWDVSSGAMEASKEEGFDYSFFFFDKYAGQIYPKTANNAFCALHKGLDYSDKVVYPEAEFGLASQKNIERAEKITAAFAKYGAAIDDKSALIMGQVKQRGNQAGFNDAGWKIWSDNYSRLLYQINPDETCIPIWRVNGPLTPTSSIYDRFARGFEHVSGKDAMYFKLHEGFSQDAKPKVMSINVVWYDGVEGSKWKLDYDAGAKTMKTAINITGKGDKKWHHEAVTIKDAVFRYGGIKGSDLALINTDDKDDIFSIVEVKRGEKDVPALLPQDENHAFSGHNKGTKYGKGENADEGDIQKKDKKGDKVKKNKNE
jgi:Beta-galactosidase